MEFNDNNEEEVEQKYNDEDYVEIYSKNAIFGFSIFSFLFATILLVINFRAAGFKRAIGEVIVFFIGFYILSAFIVKATGINVDPAALKMGPTGFNVTPAVLKQLLMLVGISLALNIAGGLVLTQYFFKKYFPDNDYYPKPILQPILIFILLSFAFSYLL